MHADERHEEYEQVELPSGFSSATSAKTVIAATTASATGTLRKSDTLASRSGGRSASAKPDRQRRDRAEALTISERRRCST